MHTTTRRRAGSLARIATARAASSRAGLHEDVVRLIHCLGGVEAAIPAGPSIDGGAWGGSGFVYVDGYAYVVSCNHVAALTEQCSLARVRPDRTSDRRAYEYRDFFGGWSTEPGMATIVIVGALIATPSYVPALGSYVVVFPDLFQVALRIGYAQAPGGPFTAVTTLFAAIPPDTFFIGGGREHQALRRGDVIAVTYATRTMREDSGVHLVRFSLAPRW